MSPRHGRRIGFLLLSCALATAALGGVNTWTPVGPDGGQVRAVAFHPTLAGVVFTAASDSIYRSTDDGQTWTAVRNGVQNSWMRFVFDPTNASRIMASAGDKLWRSDDGGLSFNPALGPVGNASFQTIAIAPNGTLYVATLNHGVFSGTNFGSTWVTSSQGLPNTDFVRDFAVDPQNSNIVYALTTQSGLYRSTDGGAHWALRNPLTNLPSFEVAVDPGAPSQLLLAAYGGVFSSIDSGANWAMDVGGSYSWIGYHVSTTGGAAVAVGDVSPTLRRSSRTGPWIAGASLKVRAEDGSFDPRNNDPVDSRLVLASAAGPLFTQDSGVSFTVHAQGIRGSSAYALAADNVGGAVYAAFQSGPIGILRRTATGWAEVDNAELLAKVTYAFQPLALAAHGNTLFVGSGTSLLKSTDAGQSWSPPYPFATLVLPRSVAFAPSDPQVAYLGGDGQSVYRTDNQGLTWAPFATGLPAAIGAVAVDPSNPNVAYAAGRLPSGSTEFYKTTNGGVSWQPRVSGLNVEALVAVAVHPTNGQTLYAGGVGNGEGLFKSVDGATSWQRVGAPIGDAPGTSIAIDPLVPTNLVMAMNSIADGAARSVDAGATWEELHYPAQLGGFPHLIRDLTLDPLKPHVIIASAMDYGLVEFEVSPDLEVLVPSAPAALALDGTGTATIRVRNRGPLAASAVKLQLTAPAGASVSTVTPAQGSCATVSGTLTCNLGVLRVGQTVDTALALRGGATPVAGTLAATVAAHESDPELANNSVGTALPTTRIANLGIALARSAAEVDRGSAVTLTATATNSGPNSSSAAQVVITLGADLTYRSATATQGTCAHAAGIVTCAIGAISSGQQAVATVEATAAAVGSLSPTATISDAVLDPIAANDSSTVTITSRAVADAGVQVTTGANPAVAGQALQYSATVTNAGPDELPATTVTITVVGASVSSASTNRGSCATTSTTATCTVSGLASGASATIDVQTVPSAAGTASATAQVTVQGTDPASANNSATQSTTVNAPPQVSGGGGGGGGGSTGLLELALLAALLALGRAARDQTNAGSSIATA